MAMRGSTVRGTPVHHVGPGQTASEGIKPGTPKGMEGTQPRNYTSESEGYRRDVRSGTPYHSEAGNGPEARRVREHGTMPESSDHGNQNDPRTNGKGVVLDGAGEYRKGYEPKDEPTLDSPVPRHAAVFDEATIPQEDRAHMGRGRGQPEQANPDLLAIGGVLSRGMDSTSRSSEPEDELTRDDTLKPGAGTMMDDQGRNYRRERE